VTWGPEGNKEVLSNEAALGVTCKRVEAWEPGSVGGKHRKCKDPEAGLS